MRVIDLDHDMSDVIPTGTSVDSEFLFERMESATSAALRVRPGEVVLDSAAGIGQDDRALARRGIHVLAAEPSRRMMELARLTDAREGAVLPGAVERVRAWSEGLPFPAGCFDAVFCKGALDHFDHPCRCIREMARVTRSDGRVVLAVANFGSLGCRLARLRQCLLGGRPAGPRRHFDVPSDHFTRYDARLLRQHAERHIHVDEWTGVSLLWGVRSWSKLLARLPQRVARRLLRMGDALARQVPALADVIVVAGRPASAD